MNIQYVHWSLKIDEYNLNYVHLSNTFQKKLMNEHIFM
jgi:hypothetical protein